MKSKTSLANLKKSGFLSKTLPISCQ